MNKVRAEITKLYAELDELNAADKNDDEEIRKIRRLIIAESIKGNKIYNEQVIIMNPATPILIFIVIVVLTFLGFEVGSLITGVALLFLIFYYVFDAIDNKIKRDRK